MPGLPAYLAEPKLPARAILLGWATATVPALILAAIVTSLVPEGTQPKFGEVGLGMFALLVLFAPAIETLIMAVALEVLLFIFPKRIAIVLSSIGWGVAHSLSAPAWGLVIWWPFLIFSMLYVTWRDRSYLWALMIPFAVHALNNFIPALLLLHTP